MSKVGTTFEAYAFHPSLGREAAVFGQITVRGGRMYFQAESMTLSFPVAVLRIEPAGDGQGICFINGMEPGWRVCTEDPTVATHPELRRVPAVRSQLVGLLGARELRSRVILTASVLGFCVLLAWLGTWVVGLMAREVVAQVPVSMDKKWGDKALADWATKHRFVDDTNEVAKLSALAQPLLAVAAPGNTNFDFHIADSKEPNAFALPGGHIVVTSGLLELADRPEQLLGVLAHEMVHVTHRHYVRKAVSSAGPLIIIGMFASHGGAIADVFTAGSALVIERGFSQEYETEADLGGWDYLVAANIDPRGMIEMFQKLEDYEAKHEEAESSDALKDHLATSKRIARLQKKWDELPVKTGFRDFGDPKLVMP